MIAAASGFEVRVRTSKRDVEVVTSMVRSWLRRAGQSRAVVVVSGTPVVVTVGRADAAPDAAGDT
jgi:hypothetical protein